MAENYKRIVIYVVNMISTLLYGVATGVAYMVPYSVDIMSVWVLYTLTLLMLHIASYKEYRRYGQ